MIKVKNNSENNLQHGCEIANETVYKLVVGEVLELPDEIAKIWLTIPGVVEYVEPKDVKKIEEQAKEEKKALCNEIDGLKAKIKELEKAQPKETTKTSKKNK